MLNTDHAISFLPPVLKSIPQELREIPQWVAWMAAPNPKKGKADKVPVDAKTGRPGSSTNPTTWASFDTATKFYHANLGKTHTIHTKDGIKTGPIAGIGFVLTEDSQIVGIDIDGCIEPNGIVKSFALQIIRRIESYTEESPSRTGVRIFVRGNIPISGFNNKAKGVEVYGTGRYLTVTGNILPVKDSIKENQDALDCWCRNTGQVHTNKNLPS